MSEYQPPTALPRNLLDNQEMKAAIAAHDFGVIFRLARSEAGISFSKIAAECGIKPERVGALSRGRGSITSFGKIVRISDALRIPGLLLGLAPRPWERNMAATKTPAPSARTSSSQGKGSSVQRREFFKASAGVGLSVGLTEISRLETGRKIGRDFPAQLRQRTQRLRQLDNILGGGDTFRVYLGEYQSTKAAIRDGSYTAETGHSLLSVLAEQAQQAGWAAFDAGRSADASSLYKESYRAAIESGDNVLAGNALALLAYQNVSTNPRAGIEMAVESCRIADNGAPSRVRALLRERLAWSYSVAGLVKETELALKSAEDALNDGETQPQPDWAAWVDGAELQIMTGRCWTELQRPIRAVPALEKALAHFNDAHARDKSLYLSYLADSFLVAGEIEEAAKTAAQVVSLSNGVASLRLRQRIAEVIKRLDAHRTVPDVAKFLGELER